jgi:serine/threonine protein phosphatase PrpC
MEEAFNPRLLLPFFLFSPSHSSTQDHHNLVDNFCGEDTKAAYFGVYDGHGGATAAKFCEDHLPKARQTFAYSLVESSLTLV